MRTAKSRTLQQLFTRQLSATAGQQGTYYVTQQCRRTHCCVSNGYAFNYIIESDINTSTILREGTVAFPLQQRLREPATMLRYTHTSLFFPPEFTYPPVYQAR